MGARPSYALLRPPDAMSAPSKKRKRKEEYVSVASGFLREALGALDAVADPCPPVKAITGVLLHMLSALDVSHFLI